MANAIAEEQVEKSMSNAAVWTVIHGIVFGSVFLLCYAGLFVGLFSLRVEWTTAEGRAVRARRLSVFAWIVTISIWLTVFTGTLMVYPTYRAPPPNEVADLTEHPRSFLLADPTLAFWHKIGMEWKEHVAWLAPMLATAASFVVTRYRHQLAHHQDVRRGAILLFTCSFLAAGIAGLLGAMINKAAPIP